MAEERHRQLYTLLMSIRATFRSGQQVEGDPDLNCSTSSESVTSFLPPSAEKDGGQAVQRGSMCISSQACNWGSEVLSEDLFELTSMDGRGAVLCPRHQRDCFVCELKQYVTCGHRHNMLSQRLSEERECELMDEESTMASKSFARSRAELWQCCTVPHHVLGGMLWRLCRASSNG